MTENNNESTDSRNEKRFTLAYEKGNWWAVRDGDITLWKEEVVYLLNQLHEENEQLRQVMGFLENDNANDILEVLNSRERIFEQLRNENEQLKQELYQQEVSEQRRKEYDEFWKEKINKGLVK